ncbi:hypothetical protein [Planctomicrobium sp. SH664]|uniref:hypothetical protein n=1 Tax=Planctomicrobium sp. SH664 TaxID=3448125 RepID=UPI003F5C6D8C
MVSQLWDDPLRLRTGGKVITAVDSDCAGVDLDCGYRASMMLGTTGAFQARKWIDKILGDFVERIDWPWEAWFDQIPFIKRFIQSFFTSGSSGPLPLDLPAWVHLRFAGQPFNRRNQSGKAFEQTDEVISRMAWRHLGQETLSLNGNAISAQGIVMLPPENKASCRHIRLRQCKIYRRYTNAMGKQYRGREEWYFLDDPTILKLKGKCRTKTTVTEQFRNPQTLMQEAPLLSLTRISSNLKWIIFRCLSVSPITGHVTDIRTGMLQLGFYFQSSSDTHVLLQSALSNDGKDFAISSDSP